MRATLVRAAWNTHIFIQPLSYRRRGGRRTSVGPWACAGRRWRHGDRRDAGRVGGIRLRHLFSGTPQRRGVRGAVLLFLGNGWHTQINFLFDKSFEPYATADDICDYFGTKKSTVSNKASEIRDMFKMGYYDEHYSTQAGRQSSPFNNLVIVDGLIVPKSMLPPEMRSLFDE